MEKQKWVSIWDSRVKRRQRAGETANAVPPAPSPWDGCDAVGVTARFLGENEIFTFFPWSLYQQSWLFLSKGNRQEITVI